tara:strand:+ start:279 stop:629 length:351 start_codon:yes stop_codon:yes gene_type:complete
MAEIIKKLLLLLLCAPLIGFSQNVLDDTEPSNNIEQATIVLIIDSLYNYSINNVVVDSKDIEKVLKTKFKELKQNGVNVEDIGINLCSDRSVHIEYIVEIFDIASRNKWRIVLSTK